MRSGFRVLLTAVLALAQGTLLASASGAQAPSFLKEWGANGGDQAGLSWPTAVAVDVDGNVYVTDWGSRRIQKYTNDGVFLTQWGDVGQGAGLFETPLGIAVSPSGEVYVTDCDNHTVQKFTSDGVFLLQWGTLGSAAGELRNPTGIAIAANGEVYVVDHSNWRVQKFTSDGVYLAQWGRPGSGDGEFGDPEEIGAGPWGIALASNGDVYVADQVNARIQKFTGAGGYISQWGTFPCYGVAVDQNDHVYVSGNDVVRAFSSSGTLLYEWGGTGSAPGQFSDPEGVAVDRLGNVFVADMYNNRIQKFGFVPTPTQRTTWGQVKHLYRK